MYEQLFDFSVLFFFKKDKQLTFQLGFPSINTFVRNIFTTALCGGGQEKEGNIGLP